MVKNEGRDYTAIMAVRKETLARHAAMRVRIYEVGLHKRKLTAAQRTAFHDLRADAKALYNAMVTSENPAAFDWKAASVPVQRRQPDGTRAWVDRPLETITTQQRQDLRKRVLSQIKTLAKLRKSGRKVGKLRPLAWFGSLHLREHGTTYRIVDRKRGILKIAGIPGHVRVHGWDRIPEAAELTCATLCWTPRGIIVKITAYEAPVAVPTDIVALAGADVIGMDPGVKHAVVLSLGVAVETTLPITPRIRLVCRKLSRAGKGTKARWKARQQLQKLHHDRSRIRDEVAHQVMHILRGVRLAIQDDHVAGWQRLWGSKVASNAVGRIISALKQLPGTVVVGRFVRTTRACRRCETQVDLGLEDRVFSCPSCRLVEHRDVHAARHIGVLSLEPGSADVGPGLMQRRETAERRLMPGHSAAAKRIITALKQVPHIRVKPLGSIQEAPPFRAG